MATNTPENAPDRYTVIKEQRTQFPFEVLWNGGPSLGRFRTQADADRVAATFAAKAQLLAIAREYAAKCPDCDGKGEVRANSYDLSMTGCNECAHIRAAIETATKRIAHRVI